MRRFEHCLCGYDEASWAALAHVISVPYLHVLITAPKNFPPFRIAAARRTTSTFNCAYHGSNSNAIRGSASGYFYAT